MGPGILTLGEYSTWRELCHRVKTTPGDAAREAAALMAASLALPSDGVLIPVPSHLGYADSTLILCEELSMLTGLPVADVLRGAERDSLYVLKRTLGAVPAGFDAGFHLVSGLPAGLRPLLVDNVIGTGFTMRSALAVVPDGIPCTLAVDYSKCRL